MRSIIFKDPYPINFSIGLNCPLTGFKLIYKGTIDSKLRFEPLDAPCYIEYTVSVLDFLSGKYLYSINYGKIEDFILGKGRLKRDFGNLLYKQAQILINFFKINGRKIAFRLNEDKSWEK